jgi:signal transduction histidine kinase
MRENLTLVTLVALISVAALCAGERTSLGQSGPKVVPTYLHDVWTTENGLPQNDVELLQTRDGYIWLATNGGLVRFDGIRFTVFDTGNTPELRSNRITGMSEGPDGTLWIGTENGGLTNYSQGKFKTFTTKDGLPDDSIFSVLADRQGNIWIGTRNSGLGRLTNGRFVVYTSRDGMPTDGVGDLLEGVDGSPWFRSGDWLMHFHAGRFERYRWIKGIPDDWVQNVSSITVANDGSLWLTTKYGLFRFQNGSFSVLTTNPTPNAPEASSTFVVHTFKDRHGELRLVTPGGLAHYEGGRVILDAPLPELSGLKIGLWSLTEVMEDREGNVWVGVGGMGLHRFRPRRVVAYTAATGLSDQGFIPITDDGTGGLWLGGKDLPNSLFHFQDGKFTPHAIDAHLRSLWRDRTGKLWIGTSKGLYQLQDGHAITEQPLDPGAQYGAVVEAIYEDGKGNLWVGTGGDEGQEGALYRLKDGLTTKYQKREGLVANDVRFIMEDRNGALWVGTTRGMSRFKDERFTNYTTEQGLSHNYVRDIHEDADGTLWIGTYGGGLNRFRDGHFTPITTRNGMFDNVVSRILVDDHDNFWMSCNRGIFRVSRKELNDFAEGRLASVTSVSYGASDGMKSSETNGGAQPAGWKSSDGKLWFPTIKGVVVIDPNNLNRLPPPVYIEEVLIGQKPANAGAPIEVRPGQGDLEIHYTGLSFIAPEKVRFKYQLEGYDRDWVEARERRVAYYTSMPPGSYTFRVMASNNDGVWSTQAAAIQIVAIPPFWRTWWFSFWVVLVLTSIVVALYQWRVRQLDSARRAQEEFSKQLIESQEGERKRIAGELHDSLSQNLVVIKNRAWLSLQEPENHQNVLEQMEEIADAAEQSLGEVREIAYNLRPFQIDRLGLTSAIESLVAKVDSPDLRFVAELDNIDKLLLPEMEINLYRIVQEGINNIIKHSEATEAHIRIKRHQDLIGIAIEDDGKGFDPNIPRSGETGNGSGFGLLGIAERARIMGSVPVIQSAVGQGTRIEIKLPCKTRG